MHKNTPEAVVQRTRQTLVKVSTREPLRALDLTM